MNRRITGSKYVKNNRSGSAPIGITSVVMIFAALCMTVFSVLTYQSAYNEYKLSDMYRRSVVSFYAADADNELFYINLCKAAESCDENADLDDLYKVLSKTAKENGAECMLISDEDTIRISRKTVIDSARTLDIVINADPVNRVRKTVWKVGTNDADKPS